MGLEKNSIKRTIISFSFALATALMTLYIQNENEEFAQNSESIEANIPPIESYVMNTID